MKKLVPLLILFLFIQSRAQDEEQTEETSFSSCSLSVKTMVYKADPGDVTGKASIEALLCDKSGAPIPYQTISITSTNGTFSCIPPNDFSGASATADRSCFVTGTDGKILVYLVDIPFNKPGRIKASCTYGDFNVHAGSSYSLSRNVTRKKVGNRAQTATTPDQ